MIEEDIARKLGVSVPTFNVYNKKYLEFSESLKKGKNDEITDIELGRITLNR